MRKDRQTKRDSISEDKTATIITKLKIGMHSAENGRLIYRDRGRGTAVIQVGSKIVSGEEQRKGDTNESD